MAIAPPLQDEIHSVHILGSASIRLGFHLESYIARTVYKELPTSTYVLITDSNIAKLHLPPLQAAFESLNSDARFLTHIISPGEESKSRQTKAAIEDWLLEQRCTRDTVLLALGGGVVGDLIGFVAATFMRGLRFCQIPTTLLAMVDSSVGGKTAIDTPLGKNLIGAFWQPAFVFIDPAYLETLPEREFVNGMAEVIKTAAIWDEAEFEKLEAGVSAIRAAVLSPPQPSHDHSITPAQQLLLSVIRASVAVKAEVVTKDEKETGLRNLVNFGHTIGHAIEAVLTPDLLHGECVSVGMVLEAEVSRALGFLRNDAVGRLSKCLAAYGLPVSMADRRLTSAPKAAGLTPERLLDLMSVDKKNAGKLKKIVLLSRIGRTVEERATGVEDALIKRVIAPCVKVFPGPPSLSKLRLTTPGSKSISNRALVLAALGTGTCRLTNLLSSDDTQVMMAALQDMGGASFSWEDGGATLVVRGGGGKLYPPPPGKEVYLGNAGTAARFLTTVCTLIMPHDQASSANLGNRTIITGNARMKQRPIGPLVDALRQSGNQLTYLGTQGCLPLEIPGGGLAGGVIELAASVSSQYVSSILLAAPYARTPVTLKLVGGTVISQPYIDMTIAMMATFGIVVRPDDHTSHVYHIPLGKYTCASGSYAIESDASSATYPLAIAALNGLTITLDNIGSASLQGDAQFATKVLGPMGCTVTQTPTSTQLTGPSSPDKLCQLGTIDMESMTDAFLTACVVLGVAGPASDGSRSTKVVGIANQRVKECDRIAAMVAELAKLGIRAEELPDGIEVFGRPASELSEGARIHCYDDHRVAMAFSVLGSVPGGKGLILDEKRCVEKTWPSWWDDFSSKMGFIVEGMGESSKIDTWKGKKANGCVTASPSILLCGMRGAGKTFAGRVAASTLGWPLIDSDLYFQDRHQMRITDYVQEYGWENFRREEGTILKEILQKSSTGHVISLGGGIVETEDGRALLKSHKGPVIQINRDMEEIVSYLHEDSLRPSLGEPIETIWKRRQPWLLDCSNSEFYNLEASADPATQVTNEQRAMRQFFDFITGNDTNHVVLRPGLRTYFVSLTFPSFTDPRSIDLPAFSNFEQLTIGSDAVELRVDLLSSDGSPLRVPQIPSLDFVRRQLAALRTLTSLPVIFTVRSHGQGGMFPAEGAEKDYFDLLKLGLRSGCEYVDVELGHSLELTHKIKKSKGHTLLIGSYHDVEGRLKWDSAEMELKYRSLCQYSDLVKLVTVAQTLDDNLALLNFRTTHTQASSPPLITINMGLAGQMSRILSPVMSPLTHSLLPHPPAAPGQISYAEIQRALELLGQHSPRRFWLFGEPIGHSRSPLMHNTSFRSLELRSHVYTPLETGTLQDEAVQAAIRAPEFGGASVTIPLKVDVLALMDELTEEARAVGAVNTIIKDGQRLVGDNTDWIAIAATVRRSLPADPDVRAAAVVVGAGGTSRAAVYALHRLGVGRIGLVNRTKARAEELLATMPSEWGISLLENFDAAIAMEPGIVISTVPTGTTRIPDELLTRAGGGVVVEMAYGNSEGYETMTEMVKRLGQTSWKVVNGLEVLVEQGAKQFEIWTGKRMPLGEVWKAIRENEK